jgi:hypothetical protein
MLVFFDETFRTSLRQPNISFGALCGIGIPEKSMGRTATDVYQLKRSIARYYEADGRLKSGLKVVRA